MNNKYAQKLDEEEHDDDEEIPDMKYLLATNTEPEQSAPESSDKTKRQPAQSQMVVNPKGDLSGLDGSVETVSVTTTQPINQYKYKNLDKAKKNFNIYNDPNLMLEIDDEEDKMRIQKLEEELMAERKQMDDVKNKDLEELMKVGPVDSGNGGNSID